MHSSLNPLDWLVRLALLLEGLLKNAFTRGGEAVDSTLPTALARLDKARNFLKFLRIQKSQKFLLLLFMRDKRFPVVLLFAQQQTTRIIMNDERQHEVALATKKRRSLFERLYEESTAIAAQDAWKAGEVAYINRVMVQATFPYVQPRGNPSVWTRRAGDFWLVIQPAMFQRPGDSAPTSLGYPYGTKPRLIVAWMGAEVKRTRSRELHLGRSLAEFLRALGLDSTGGDNGTISLIKRQVRALLSSRIALMQDPRGDPATWAMHSMQIADSQNLLWSINPNQRGLFESTIVLSERFYQEIYDHSVPVDMRALRALKYSPYALDLYSWMTYRMSSITKPTAVPWESLMLQFGSEMSEVRNFRTKIYKHLKAVAEVYPQANFEVTRSSLVLKPSRTSVPKLSHRQDA
jgi:Plasmid encoded RepA protein